MQFFLTISPYSVPYGEQLFVNTDKKFKKYTQGGLYKQLALRSKDSETTVVF